MKAVAASLALALGGIALVAVEAAADPTRAAFASLSALSFGIATGWGALLVLMTGLASRASWVAVYRRPLEAMVASLPVLSLGVALLLAFAPRLYPWMEGGPALAPHARHAIEATDPWHARPWLYARSALYLGVPLVLGELTIRLSRRVTRDGDARLDGVRSRLAVGGLVALVALGSFAAFDWVMALEPAWVSTIYGLIWLASGYVTALAILVLAVAAIRRAGGLRDLPRDAVHRLGKLLFAATCVWAYLAFSQYLLMYLADLPSEVRWYLRRQAGAWGWVGLGLIVGGFALPSLALLPVAVKRRLTALAPLAALVVLAHAVEHAWLVLPARPEVGLPWATLAAFAAVGGAASATASIRARRTDRLPRRDPLLREALEAE
ncbi:MAG TPA: hypothetical protein RMH99_18155 [Sandaracinaceae bacterium LLY-WYZ-13_1]|nr:hypothetical protein [Sandaracinaceae bacterium LLY-WYZ-13_1]